jgi:FKBP-type peptidyl-prolyl cis-trans isomerase
MRRNALPVLVASAVLAACADAAPKAPKTDEEKAMYSLGVLLSPNIQPFTLTPQEMEMVKAGLADGAVDKPKIEDVESFVPKLQELQQQRTAAATEKEKAAGVAYIAKAAGEANAKKTDSGLVIKTVSEGSGASPKPEDVVKVHYEGRFVDGKVFDSSIKRKEPAVFPLNGVIPCWTEAVQTMKVGGKAQLACPPELAYGEEGRPPKMRGGATLVFDVELLEIMAPEAAGGAGPQASPTP